MRVERIGENIEARFHEFNRDGEGILGLVERRDGSSKVIVLDMKEIKKLHEMLTSILARTKRV